MTSEQIGKFLSRSLADASLIDISFKKRNKITGVFVLLPDFDFLKSKNLWRIVGAANIEAYKKTKNIELVRIYNGIEFTRLELN